MNYEKATQVYKDINENTITNVEFVLIVLKGIRKSLQKAYALQSDKASYKKEIKRIQALLFELMAVSNRRTEEGERLFSLYVYLNQLSLVVEKQYDGQLLMEFEYYFQQMEEAWSDIKQKSRMRKSMTNLL